METKRFNELVFLKLLLSIDGIGPQKIFNLLAKFHAFENVFLADQKSLNEVEGISSTLSAKIVNAKSNYSSLRNSFEKELEKLSSLNGNIITYFDNEFPSLLKNIYFPPIFLYTIGNIKLLNENCIAVVGTREPSAYGKMVAEKFASELVKNGLTVVSGLARGIDSIAHSSTINANGNTIAVIGTGLDIVYPPENKKLFERIKEHGLIISEYELGTKPDAQNFPRRNRIISGISLGTLVVETKIVGGALYTAAYALDQGREVFAIPGPINNKQSDGTNSLIQKGEAKLVVKVEDILNELKLSFDVEKEKTKPKVELTLFEEKIFSVIDNNPKQIDEIAELTNLPTSECLVHLLTMEFKGLVKQLPGKMFIVA